MRARLSRLSEIPFLRHVGALVSGTAVAQVVAVGVSPILSRLYSPEDFGRFSSFLAASAVLGALATLRYDAAVLLPDRDDDARSVVGLCVVLSGATALVTGAAIAVWWFAGAPRQEWLDLGGLVWWLAPLMLLQGVQLSLRQWDVRRRAFPRIARNGVLQSVTNAAASVAAGAAGATGSGLVGSTVLAQGLATTAYLSAVWHERAPLVAASGAAALARVARRFQSFVLYGTPALLASRLAQQSLIVLAGAYLGPAVLGHIFLIHRIIGLPSTLIGSALGDVFYGEISRSPRTQAFPKIAAFAVRLTGLSVAIYLVMGVALEYLFVPVFGAEWADAVPYLRSLTLVALFSFIFAPLSVLFDYFEAQRLNLLWQAGWLVTNVAVFAVCNAWQLTPLQTITVFALKQAAWYAVGIAAFLWLAKREAR